MKIMLVYGYSANNAGDMAINLGAIDLFLRNGHDVSILSRYHSGTSEYEHLVKYLDGRYSSSVKVYPCPFRLQRGRSILIQAWNYLYSLAAYIGLCERDWRNLVSSSNVDLVVFNGGNLLRCESLPDFLRLLALLKPLRYTNVPFIIGPQSAKQINKLGDYLVHSTLADASYVFVRDSISLDLLKKRFPSVHFELVHDFAFGIDLSSTLENTTKKLGKVAFTLRGHGIGDISSLSDDDVDSIIAYYEKLSEKVIQQGFGILVVCQSFKDEDISRRLVSNLKVKYDTNVELFLSNDVGELLSIYRSVDLLIGMRLHSLILALRVKTPVYGCFFEEWGFKNPGILSECNMDYLVLDGVDINSMELDFDIKSYIADKELVISKLHTQIHLSHNKIVKAIGSHDS